MGQCEFEFPIRRSFIALGLAGGSAAASRKARDKLHVKAMVGREADQDSGEDDLVGDCKETRLARWVSGMTFPTYDSSSLFLLVQRLPGLQLPMESVLLTL